MPEIELESLVWLVWGGSLVGLQSSISITLNLKKKKFLSIIGGIYFLSIFCLSLFLSKDLVLFYKILTLLLGFGIVISIILIYTMIRQKNWCGICLRVHFANLVLLVTLIEAWPKLNFFSWSMAKNTACESSSELKCQSSKVFPASTHSYESWFSIRIEHSP